MASVDVFLFCFCQMVVVSVLLFLLLRRRSEDEQRRAYQFYRIPEFDGDGFHENRLYRRVSIYIKSLPVEEGAEFTNLFEPRNSTEIVFGLDLNGSVEDSFLGAKIWWKNEEDDQGRKAFVLKICRKDKPGLLWPYLQHVQAKANEIVSQKKELRLFTSSNGRWMSASFRHPATFDAVAMEPDIKRGLQSDLETFAKGRQFYNRVGRSWKRGYLFYGASGTGKSTTIAAMANFLCFDIYVIELPQIMDDSELKILLQQTTSRSILVVEDTDEFLLSIVNSQRMNGVTASGVLNMLDGVWSCSEEQRIMLFTMGSKDGIDPAFLRPGRLDVHVFFPACTFLAFKILACNYLGVNDHKLFSQVEEYLQAGPTLTPAEIGEVMIVHRSSPTRALKSVIQALQLSCRRMRRSCISYAGDDNIGGVGGLSDSTRIVNREICMKVYSFLRMRCRRKLPELSYEHKES